MRRLVLLLAALCTLALGLPAPAAADAPPGTPAGALPDTPVARQLSWVMAASRHLPVPEAEIREHLSPAYLDAVGADGFNALLAEAAGDEGLRLDSYRPQRAPRDGSEAYALVSGEDGLRHHAVVLTDESGGLAHLSLTPLPGAWAELDRRLESVAPRVSFLAAELDEATGACRPVHGLAPDEPRPVGSAFKLYVLGALADAVRAGHAAWEEPLAVREEWKADAGGSPVSELPAGTVLTLREFAEYMIFYSDNSATDHLIRRLGREAVEVQQARFGMAAPEADRPFLMARELGQLKTVDYPRHADAYARLSEPARRAYLAGVVAGLPTPGGSAWDVPRHIDTVEWFASPADLCRAFGGLRAQAGTPGLQPVDGVMSQAGTRNLGLDEEAWPVGWFKGGSEPGVISRTYLAGSGGTGETYVVSVMASDPAEDVSTPEGVAELLALSAGAFELLR
ncbi:serine hydrolase [Streptomyces sp. 6N223]|uniref:serine hydrolase n=1 Tax=Streptomyces sp. 6N223 TaxID=3457412 RepID=UPI003FCF4D99